MSITEASILAASGLPEMPREFVIYESSLSDIIGVLVFYAWLGADGSPQDIAIEFVGGGVISLTIALILAPGIFVFINRLERHVRFRRLPCRRIPRNPTDALPQPS